MAKSISKGYGDKEELFGSALFRRGVGVASGVASLLRRRPFCGLFVFFCAFVLLGLAFLFCFWYNILVGWVGVVLCLLFFGGVCCVFSRFFVPFARAVFFPCVVFFWRSFRCGCVCCLFGLFSFGVASCLFGELFFSLVAGVVSLAVSACPAFRPACIPFLFWGLLPAGFLALACVLFVASVTGCSSCRSRSPTVA